MHTHGARAGFYGRLAARWADTRIILSTVHSSIYNYPISRAKKRIYVFLDKMTSSLCDKLICVSKTVADELINRSKIHPQKIQVIHNGIDLAKFNVFSDTSYLREEFNLSKGQRVIGVIAMMDYWKGQRYLLEALPEIIKSFPNIRCLMVGDGPLREDLEQLAVDLNISQSCIFTGIRSNVAEILSILDILVLPSLGEAFPFILLEAMAMRCAIVASRVGGVEEIIEDGKTGLLVPPADSKTLAQAIKGLLLNQEKANQISSYAQKVVQEKFSLKQMISATEAVYEQIIKKNKEYFI